MAKSSGKDNIQTLKISTFDLYLTLDSGQVFGWKNENEWRVGEIYGKPVKIRQKGNLLSYISLKEKIPNNEIKKYFSLDLNAKTIYKKISTDPLMKKAIKEFYGLRLIRQDPWYCTISFVCSSFSNIPRIEKNIENIKQAYGKQLKNGIFIFPTIAELKKANKEKLRKCGLGFRDRYVHEIANRMSEKQLKNIKKLNYYDAKRKLMKFTGIGEKVADCILLFSFNKGEAFPIDIWIARIMKRQYGNEIKKMFPNTKYSYKDIQSFAKTKWGDHAGYAQQFLYMYARKHKIK